MAARTTTVPAGQRMCECGHKQALHTHYRRGDDCALCSRRECSQFQPADLPLRWSDVRDAAVFGAALGVLLVFFLVVRGTP